ncbi:hypothetical protein INT43_004978 [Umbelopsis isabellina]|uniref:Ice-binding protein n=1 Tax=Mortierella isabellina TaxID=91625 RepID=A0A8H7PEH9_MORIS|nr:hypothetical protein INT43_004978 [Umbelopsis isabellina]
MQTTFHLYSNMKAHYIFACALSFTAIINAQVPLGSASSYALLAGSDITNHGLTQIFGNVGLSPESSITGFGPGLGTISQGTTNVDNPAAVSAKADAQNAFTVAGSFVATPISPALTGQSLVSGVYSLSTALLTVGGTLTLDGQNNPDSIWVFQIAYTLIAETSSTVALINGANGCNVFWQVGSSATLGVGSTFVGNILAEISISLDTSATNLGGLYALTGGSHKHGGWHHKEKDDDSDQDKYEEYEDDNKYEKGDKHEDENYNLEDCENDKDKDNDNDHEYSYK